MTSHSRRFLLRDGLDKLAAVTDRFERGADFLFRNRLAGLDTNRCLSRRIINFDCQHTRC